MFTWTAPPPPPPPLGEFIHRNTLDAALGQKPEETVKTDHFWTKCPLH